MSNKISRFSRIAFSLVVLCNDLQWAACQNLRDPSTQERKPPRQRPVMYTFFQMKLRRDGKLDTGGEHEEMLAAWTEAWTDAGWDTKILTLEDAEKHPEFEHYSKKFMQITDTSSFIFGNSYNYMCLMRWLAMAAQNVDGWMSDYDTFPLNISPSDGLDLPNAGKFTVYQRFVPSLMSGSASEWNKLAILVIEEVLQMFRIEGSQYLYSDMYALEDVHKLSSNAYISIRRVDYFPYIGMNKMDCERANNALAVHLGHDPTEKAVKDGLIPPTINGKNRHTFAKTIRNHWKEQCLHTNFSS